MNSRFPIFIRPAQPSDIPVLVELGKSADMGVLEGFDTTLVAHFENGKIAGFCRIRIFDNVAYVNPIVTADEAKGQGVGSSLMEAARKTYGELRFVARGSAVPFYYSIGCEEIPWGMICPEVGADCKTCPDFAECNPLPMMMLAEQPQPASHDLCRRPIIGITTDINFDTNLCSTNHEYQSAVWAAGGIPLMVPPMEDSPEYTSAMCNALDGLILSGGGDIDPTEYGQAEHHPELKDVQPQRDRFEISLVQEARKTGLPTLGICRGLQIMNVALGGTLVQHIEDTNLGEAIGAHASAENAMPSHMRLFAEHSQPKPYTSPSHLVRIKGDTKLHDIMSGRAAANNESHDFSIPVNSMHHQAIDYLSPSLTASAYCGAMVEGAEDPNAAFFLGVQWHPEYMENGRPLFAALCQAALMRCETRRASKR